MLLIEFYDNVKYVTTPYELTGRLLKTESKAMLINPSHITNIIPEDQLISLSCGTHIYVTDESYETIYQYFVNNIYAQ